MATTTPNYGWTVPTSTDLVKDGATAIETLGDAIDASMNTALGTKKAGMVLLNTTSFSGVASQSVNDVFSSTYDNYVVYVSDLIASSGTPSLYMRMRVSAADNSSAQYSINYIVRSSASLASGQTLNGTFWDFGSIDATQRSFMEFKFSNANQAKTTALVTNTNNTYQNGSGLTYAIGGGAHAVSTAYTGFTIYPSANNISGTISVYGVNK